MILLIKRLQEVFMKKKKYLIGLALAALSLTTLVACGDDKPATEPEQEVTQENDEITITVQNKKYQ